MPLLFSAIDLGGSTPPLVHVKCVVGVTGDVPVVHVLTIAVVCLAAVMLLRMVQRGSR